MNVEEAADLAASDFERLRKPTRREKILAEMSAVVPCKKLAAVIEPHYPKRTSVGCRPPVERDRVLRIHCLQLWFNLSDPALEEALYDSLAMRSFVGIDLGRGPVPDEATVMRFRYLLKKQKLGERIFEQVGRLLVQRGLRLSKSTIVGQRQSNRDESAFLTASQPKSARLPGPSLARRTRRATAFP